MADNVMGPGMIVALALGLMFLVQALKRWSWFDRQPGLIKLLINFGIAGGLILIVGDKAIELLKNQAYLLILPMLAADMHTAKKHGEE